MRGGSGGCGEHRGGCGDDQGGCREDRGGCGEDRGDAVRTGGDGGRTGEDAQGAGRLRGGCGEDAKRIGEDAGRIGEDAGRIGGMRSGPGRMRGGSGRMRSGPGGMGGGPGRMREEPHTVNRGRQATEQTQRPRCRALAQKPDKGGNSGWAASRTACTGTSVGTGNSSDSPASEITFDGPFSYSCDRLALGTTPTAAVLDRGPLPYVEPGRRVHHSGQLGLAPVACSQAGRMVGAMSAGQVQRVAYGKATVVLCHHRPHLN